MDLNDEYAMAIYKGGEEGIGNLKALLQSGRVNVDFFVRREGDDEEVWLRRTPLHLALRCESVGAVDILLQHGAKVDNPDLMRVALNVGRRRGDFSLAQILLAHGADINARCAAYSCIRIDYWDAEDPCDDDYYLKKAVHLCTHLDGAILSSSVAQMEFLSAHGFDFGRVDKCGFTPLQHAVATWLWQNTADHKAFVRRLARDFTPDITTLWDTSHVNEPTLMEAAVDKKREDVVAFLKEMGWPEE